MSVHLLREWFSWWPIAQKTEHCRSKRKKWVAVIQWLATEKRSMSVHFFHKTSVRVQKTEHFRSLFCSFLRYLYVETNLTYNIRPWQERQQKWARFHIPVDTRSPFQILQLPFYWNWEYNQYYNGRNCKGYEPYSKFDTHNCFLLFLEVFTGITILLSAMASWKIEL